LPDASLSMAIRQGTPPPFWYSPRTVWPGPFGAIMMTSTRGLRLDQAEMHVEAVGEGDRRAVADVVVRCILVDVGLQLVRHRHHDQVGPGGGFGDGHDLEAVGLGLLGALAEPSRSATTTFLAPLSAGSARGHGPASHSRGSPPSCP
jgi:hypothetical protein